MPIETFDPFGMSLSFELRLTWVEIEGEFLSTTTTSVSQPEVAVWLFESPE